MAELMSRDASGDNCTNVFATLVETAINLIHPDAFTDEDKRKFEDPEYYKQFRKELESDLNVCNPQGSGSIEKQGRDAS